MDDDLMSLRGSSSSSDDDNLFDFSSGDTASEPAPAPGGGASDPFDFMSDTAPPPAKDPFEFASPSTPEESSSSDSFDLDFGSAPAAPVQGGGLLDDLDMPAPAKETAKTETGKKTLFGGFGKKSAPAAKGKGKGKPKRKSSGKFMGLSPMQGMILSIFLFLDISVMGLMVLVAIGAIVP